MDFLGELIKWPVRALALSLAIAVFALLAGVAQHVIIGGPAAFSGLVDQVGHHFMSYANGAGGAAPLGGSVLRAPDGSMVNLNDICPNGELVLADPKAITWRCETSGRARSQKKN